MQRIIVAGAGLCVAYSIVTALLPAEKPKRQPDESIALFEEVLDRVQQYHHPEKYTRRQLVEAAIEGMLLKVDPDARFLNEDALLLFSETVTREHGDIHLGVRFERHLTVVPGWRNSGALEAGILPGDQIVEIDGKSVSTMSGSQVGRALDGPPDSRVTIKVVPLSTRESRTVSLVRRP